MEGQPPPPQSAHLSAHYRTFLLSLSNDTLLNTSAPAPAFPSWIYLQGAIKKYSECLNLKVYYIKRHIAINDSQNILSLCFKYTYPVVLGTFGSSSESYLY